MPNRNWILAIGLLVTEILSSCQTGGQTLTEESVPVLSTPEIVEVTSAHVIVELTRISQGIDAEVVQAIHPPLYKADVRTLVSEMLFRRTCDSPRGG
jgi:hypothetical protein